MNRFNYNNTILKKKKTSKEVREGWNYAFQQSYIVCARSRARVFLNLQVKTKTKTHLRQKIEILVRLLRSTYYNTIYLLLFKKCKIIGFRHC